MDSTEASLTLDLGTISVGQSTRVTIANALAAVATWRDLSERQRAPMLTALRLAAKLANRPAAEIALSPAGLRQSMLTRSPAALGIRLGTFANLRSALKAVCKRLCLINGVDGPISDAWTELLPKGGDKSRYAFVGFARYATALGITPAQVSDAAIAWFEAHLTDRTHWSRCPGS